jgi:hypothetical protein
VSSTWFVETTGWHIQPLNTWHSGIESLRKRSCQRQHLVRRLQPRAYRRHETTFGRRWRRIAQKMSSHNRNRCPSYEGYIRVTYPWTKRPEENRTHGDDPDCYRSRYHMMIYKSLYLSGHNTVPVFHVFFLAYGTFLAFQLAKYLQEPYSISMLSVGRHIIERD